MTVGQSFKEMHQDRLGVTFFFLVDSSGDINHDSLSHPASLWGFFPPQASVSYHLHHSLVFISLVLFETQWLCLLTTFFWGRKRKGGSFQDLDPQVLRGRPRPSFPIRHFPGIILLSVTPVSLHVLLSWTCTMSLPCTSGNLLFLPTSPLWSLPCLPSASSSFTKGLKWCGRHWLGALE